MDETTTIPDDFYNSTTDISIETAPTVNIGTNISPLSNLSNGLSEFFNSIFTITNQCADSPWQQSHHVYFQVANALFLIAFLSPHKSYGFLMARCALVFASILMTMWSYLIQCSLDALIWSGLFLLVNFIYLSVLIYRMRPIRFEKEIDAVIIYQFGRFMIYF